MVEKSQNSDGGSFLTGFTVGMFVGAAGYYLFATEKGSKMRKQLVAEWESAKVNLVEDGLIENPKVSLREFIQDLLHKAFPEEGKARTPKSVLLARDVTNKAKKDSAKKFKGT